MKIGVIGAGNWGTALASLLASDPKNKVFLWAFEPEVAEGINQRHENRLYCPGHSLPTELYATSDWKEAVDGAEILLNVTPSHVTRSVWEKMEREISKETVIVNASKGFEFATKKRLSEVLMEILPKHPKNHFVVLSGPSFAKEVLQHRPTTVVIAGGHHKIAEKVQRIFRRDWFLTYVNEDLIGVEVGGAVKNVIAIAAGICQGMGLGCNTRAALITRGLYEMAKLGKALGANPITFVGLSGMGDLVLTCTSSQSRNHTVGERLGQGEPLEAICKEMKTVAEGIQSAKVVYELIREYKINNPVCAAIYRILYEKKRPSQALKDLLAINLKEELGGLLK